MRRPSNSLLGSMALAVAAVALAAGCGSSDETSGATTDTTTTTAPTSSLKVGLVADAGELNDNGFNELALRG